MVSYLFNNFSIAKEFTIFVLFKGGLETHAYTIKEDIPSSLKCPTHRDS
jgi:hypothetical protein